MSPDAMTVRLHLRRIRVVAVVVDLIERLVVEIADVRRVVRCPHCGFKTTRVHDGRRLQVRDLPSGGRPTELVWVRRRFSCGEYSERHWDDHPEIILGRRTHVTRRLARQLVKDVNVMSIREVARRHDLPWHFIMDLTRSWSDRVAADRRRRRCRVLLVDETSLRRGHRYVTVLINGDTGETLGIVAHRNAAALSDFLLAQGHRWLKGGPRWWGVSQADIRHELRRKSHPRLGPVSCGTLVRRRDDRGPATYPTDRPPRLPSRIRTGGVPVPLPPTHPLRPSPRRPDPTPWPGASKP